jgi:hypothetical protein
MRVCVRWVSRRAGLYSATGHEREAIRVVRAVLARVAEKERDAH